MARNDTEIRNEIIYDTKNSEKNVGSLEKKLRKLIGAAALAFATKKIFEFGQAFETTFAKATTLIDTNIVISDFSFIRLGSFGIATSNFNGYLFPRGDTADLWRTSCPFSLDTSCYTSGYICYYSNHQS